MRNLLTSMVALFILMATILSADQWQDPNPGEKPPARYGHSMVEVNSDLYVFGGINSNGRVEFFNDLWRWSQEAWEQQLPTNTPPSRHSHSAAVHNDKIYIFFGQGTDGLLSDIWYYDVVAKTWQQAPSTGADKPAPRLFHTTVTMQDRIYLYGGESNQIHSDFWSYNPADGSWRAEVSHSEARYGHSAVAVDTNMFVFGGADDSGNSSKVWQYSMAANAWFPYTTSGDTPPERLFHATTLVGSSIQVIGGKNSQGDLSDHWQLDLSTSAWSRNADLPQAVSQTTAAALNPQLALQRIDPNIVLFGGRSDNNALDLTLHYFAEDPPTPPSEGIVNQIASLRRGQQTLLILDFKKKQQKLHLELEWSESQANLRLLALKLPWRHSQKFIWRLLQRRQFSYAGRKFLHNRDWQRSLAMLGRFQIIGDSNVRSRNQENKITKDLKNVRFVALLVSHCRGRKVVHDVQLRITEMTDNPRKVAYAFPLGKSDSQSGTHFVRLPVEPKRWHSCGTHGRDTTEKKENYWEWRYVPGGYSPWLGFVKFYLPQK